MDIDVRTIVDAEVPAWCAAMNTGFLNASGDVDAEARRPGLVLDRTWAGFDGPRVVSTLRSFPTRLTVPGGGALEVSGVTAVTTTSTHRRRGLASRMVAAELAAARERGERASILIAAEWEIYGRFGYGACAEHQNVTVDPTLARLRKRPQGTVEYVDRDTARAAVVELYERHRSTRPGEFVRPERFWDLDFDLLRLPSWGEPKRCFHVLARDPDGVPVGMARYSYEDGSHYRAPMGEVAVGMLIGTGPLGEALLWQHLLDLDLTSSVRADNRPVDELLPWLLADARTFEPSARSDFLWLRPLDVAALLSARCYPAPGRLVLEVVDPAGPAAGRFALDGGPDGASCAPTGASADLTLGVDVLGSVSLGGYGLRTLAAAGLVDEHTTGAVSRADTMFRWPVAPWCSAWF